jgi:hypothetical protein
MGEGVLEKSILPDFGSCVASALDLLLPSSVAAFQFSAGCPLKTLKSFWRKDYREPILRLLGQIFRGKIREKFRGKFSPNKCRGKLEFSTEKGFQKISRRN